MAAFTDYRDRRWTLTITFGDVERIKDEFGIDLYDVQHGGFERLIDEPRTLVGVLWLVCEAQADKQQIDETEFARGFAGDTLSDAADAFLEALVESYPKPRRPALQKVLAKLRTLESRAVERAQRALESPEVEQELERYLDEAFPAGTSGTTSGSSPASPASTPGRSPSGSS